MMTGTKLICCLPLFGQFGIDGILLGCFLFQNQRFDWKNVLDKAF